jgi:DNA uptake protein ComE-like DNA-binding protein
MSKRLYREFYLLPRGEQRALILLSLLLILSLGFRIIVRCLPEPEPAGMAEFEQEASMLMAALAEADSLRLIDINRADSLQLLPLPGIGPVFAARIVKYRNLLGGFTQADQLLEVYGMNINTLEMIIDRIVLDTTLIVKLDLNRASFGELLRHPYLEYEDVKSLVNYRDFKGIIQSLGELKENFILPDSLLQKVMPYFCLSN